MVPNDGSVGRTLILIGRAAGRAEYTQHPERLGTAVLQAMGHPRRQVDAGPRLDRRVPVADVHGPAARQDVDGLLVGVGMEWGPAPFDEPHELRDVPGAVPRIDHELERAILPGG